MALIHWPKDCAQLRGTYSGAAVRTRPAHHDREQHPAGGGGLRPISVVLHHTTGPQGQQGEGDGGSPPGGRMEDAVPPEAAGAEDAALVQCGQG